MAKRGRHKIQYSEEYMTDFLKEYETHTVNQMADLYYCSPATVSRLVGIFRKDLGRADERKPCTSKRPPKYSPEKLKYILFVSESTSCKEMAEMYGCSVSTVHRIIKKAKENL